MEEVADVTSGYEPELVELDQDHDRVVVHAGEIDVLRPESRRVPELVGELA